MWRGVSGSGRPGTFPGRRMRISIATCRDPKPGRMDGTRFQTSPRWPGPSAATASPAENRSLPTIRTKACSPAAYGGCCAGSATMPLRSSMADSQNGLRKDVRFQLLRPGARQLNFKRRLAWTWSSASTKSLRAPAMLSGVLWMRGRPSGIAARSNRWIR